MTTRHLAPSSHVCACLPAVVLLLVVVVSQLVFSVGSTLVIFPLCRIFSLPNYVAIALVVTLNTALLWTAVIEPTFVARWWQCWTLVAEGVFLLHVWRLKRTWRTWRPEDARSRRHKLGRDGFQGRVRMQDARTRRRV